MIANLVFLGFLSAGCALMAMAAFISRDYWWGTVSSALAIFVALIVAGVAPLQRVRRSLPSRGVTAYVTALGERGVRIPYSGWWYGWLVTVMAMLSVGYVAAVIAVLVTSDSAALPYQLLAIGLLGVVVAPYCGWFLSDMLRGRLPRGYLLLTSRGVHHRYLAYDEFVPWDSLLNVRPGYQQGPVVMLDVLPDQHRRLTSGATLRRSPPAGPVELHCRLLAADPAVVYHAIVYYWKRRDMRAELANGVGLNRVRTGDVPVSPQ